MVGATDEGEKSDRTDLRSQRRTARLAAVQALYQIEIGGEAVELVLREFPERLIPNMFDDGSGAEIDRDFFDALVRGVADKRAEIDAAIRGAMTRDVGIDRLEPLLKVVMRAGVYELMARYDVPARVALAEHVAICHAFYGERETGLVNGVLDRVARTVRREEMVKPDAEPGDRAAGDAESGSDGAAPAA
ncbi:MAG: transcription antitermination factor NusB [Alphaproteobacteria bacterium]